MSTLYPALDGFVAPARDRAQIWRLLVGLIVAVLIYILIMLAIIAAAVWIAAPPDFLADIANWDGVGPNPIEREVQLLLNGQSPTQVLVILSTFGGMLLGAMAAAYWLHGRGFVSLTGPLPKLFRHFGLAVLITVPFFAVSFFIPPTLMLEPMTETSVWLTFLPMAIAMIALQTGAEEFLFRGYLQSQLAARFKSPLVWMLLPSVLFGLGHLSPDQFGDSAWVVVGVTTAVGLFAADLTARTGSLGAAWGFHFANNVVAILIVSLEGPLAGLSLWVIPSTAVPPEAMNAALLRDLAVITVIWLAIRQIIRR